MKILKIEAPRLSTLLLSSEKASSSDDERVRLQVGRDWIEHCRPGQGQIEHYPFEQQD